MTAPISKETIVTNAGCHNFHGVMEVEEDFVKLTAITAALTQLASDKAFAEFLDAPVEEEVIEEETVIEPDGEEEEEEFDFAQRMRR